MSAAHDSRCQLSCGCKEMPVFSAVLDIWHRVAAIEHIGIAVKFLDTLGILEDSFPGASDLPFVGAVFDILRPLSLVLNRQCINQQCICQFLAQFHGAQAWSIRFPDTVLVAIPGLLLRNKPGNIPVTVGKQPATINVCPGIAVIIFRANFAQKQCWNRKVRSCAGDG